MNIRDLQAKRGDIVATMEKMLDDASNQGRDLTAEESRKFDDLNEQQISLRDQINRRDQVANATAVPIAPIGGGQDFKNSLTQFLRSGDKSAFRNAGTIGTDADGGFTVVPDFDRRLFETIAETNPVFGAVQRVTTGSNEFQRVYTVSGAASGRVAESGTRTETDTPTYAKQTVNLSMQYAYPSVSEELVLSSAFDIAEHVQREIRLAFDADFEAEILTGSGSAPAQKGILTAADSADADGTRAFTSYQLLSSGSAGDFDYDDLVTLFHSLPPKYRRNAALYASTSAVELMRKLKDTTDMPLWRDADRSTGRPSSIMGVPVIEVPSLPAVGTDSKSLVFGDLSQAYCFVSHNSGLQVLRDPYSTPGFIKYYARMLCGSGPMDTRALRVMALSA